MPRKLIAQLQDQEQVDQTFKVLDKQMRANRQGGKYVLMRLGDRSGVLTGMLWNAEEPIFLSFEKGDIVRCRGRLQVYNGGLQIIVNSLAREEPNPAEQADFQRFDASRSEQLAIRLRELIENLNNPWLKKIGLAFLDDDRFMESFSQSAAAISHHHAFPGGLIQHTVDLMELASTVAPRYENVDPDLVILGAFLHDIGKTEELAGGDELSYTDRGQLVGHIVIGTQMLAEKINAVQADSEEAFPQILRWQLEHLILSHHGQLEYGSPKIPLTLEAILLHHLDNLDAKMAAALSVIQADVAGEGSWTNYNPSLGRKLWKDFSTNHDGA